MYGAQLQAISFSLLLMMIFSVLIFFWLRPCMDQARFGIALIPRVLLLHRSGAVAALFESGPGVNASAHQLGASTQTTEAVSTDK